MKECSYPNHKVNAFAELKFHDLSQEMMCSVMVNRSLHWPRCSARLQNGR